MGYADQKYYERLQDMVADSNYFTGTYTASVTAQNGTSTAPWSVPTFKRTTKIYLASVVTKTANKIGTVTITMLNGTHTIGTAVSSSTASAGTEVAFTMLNTASLSTNTNTIVAANGSTNTTTVTVTTDWTVVASNTAPTFTVTGSASTAGDTAGSYEVFFTTQEVFV